MQKKMIVLLIISGITIAILGALLLINRVPQMGAKSKGASLEKIVNSQNFSNGAFHNIEETVLSFQNGTMREVLKERFLDKIPRSPEFPLPSINDKHKKEFNSNSTDIKIRWLGHSTIYIEVDNTKILIDPVLSERASPFSFMGPKAFEGSIPLKARDFTDIDIIILSHDHYDHMDYKTIKALHKKTKKFMVPLGLAAHLERWGVPNEKIVELDWWEETTYFNKIKLTATPGRHFSGRGIKNRNTTLWCSWVIELSGHKLFFCGDSGYTKSFKEIGEKFGPFDLTMMEAGQFSQYWPQIHMMPEETVQAHIDLKGKILLPIHWAKFNLSLHSWTEPIQRVIQEANNKNVKVATPKIGEVFILQNKVPTDVWWMN